MELILTVHLRVLESLPEFYLSVFSIFTGKYLCMHTLGTWLQAAAIFMTFSKQWWLCFIQMKDRIYLFGYYFVLKQIGLEKEKKKQTQFSFWIRRRCSLAETFTYSTI